MDRMASLGPWRAVDGRLFAINAGLLGCLLGAVSAYAVVSSLPVRIAVGTTTALVITVALYRLLCGFGEFIEKQSMKTAREEFSR